MGEPSDGRRGGVLCELEDDTGIVTGRFPRRALGLALEWHDLHRSELLDNWDRARKGEPLQAIAPFE